MIRLETDFVQGGFNKPYACCCLALAVKTKNIKNCFVISIMNHSDLFMIILNVKNILLNRLFIYSNLGI